MNEQKRQQALMAALWRRDEAARLPSLLLPSARNPRGLQAYQANAGASAERALSASFPTVRALVGEDSFAALARVFWHEHPPERGDLACFGEALPIFIAGSEQLADVPYLADAARLDWLLALAERAPDDVAEPATLGLLAEADASQLQLELMPGAAVLSSIFPVVSVWQAHQAGEGASAHRVQAREALAAARGEHALVWRSGWRAVAIAVSDSTARWTTSLLRGDSLATALTEAGEVFAFEPWLVQALQQGWIARARIVA